MPMEFWRVRCAKNDFVGTILKSGFTGGRYDSNRRLIPKPKNKKVPSFVIYYGDGLKEDYFREAAHENEPRLAAL